LILPQKRMRLYNLTHASNEKLRKGE